MEMDQAGIERLGMTGEKTREMMKKEVERIKDVKEKTIKELREDKEKLELEIVSK